MSFREYADFTTEANKALTDAHLWVSPRGREFQIESHHAAAVDLARQFVIPTPKGYTAADGLLTSGWMQFWLVYNYGSMHQIYTFGREPTASQVGRMRQYLSIKHGFAEDDDVEVNVIRFVDRGAYDDRLEYQHTDHEFQRGITATGVANYVKAALARKKWED